MSAERQSERRDGSEVVPVYVWDLVVRWTHWLIVASLLVLAATGFYIGRPFITSPGPATQHFVMGTVKAIHSYTAIVFTLAVFSRLVWMFMGPPVARWNQFIPVARHRRAGLWPTVKFYLFARSTPPPSVGHNPVAGATYTLVFLLYLLAIATGFALYSVSARVGSPMQLFSFLLPLFGGAQSARWIHHVVMWLLLGFAVHHVYSALLVSIVDRSGTMESIFSGWKFLRRNDLEASPEAPGTEDRDAA